ncbi:hypothetical protein Pelo_7142 [Pelomyxa schiedti]|nr:hypothetical protein Pelo_7142 [Pelomyxa schiedti]
MPLGVPLILMEGRMSKVQILWENQALDILGVYAPYLAHPEAADFWEHTNKRYTPSNTSATILVGDFNIPLFKHQHPSFERSANLRQAAMSTMENWDVYPVETKSPTFIQNGTCYTFGACGMI